MNAPKLQKHFFCFNPLVTFFTGILELFFALVVCFKYSKSPFGRIAAILLILLSVFQFAEYTICAGGNSVVWNKVAYAAIAFLPAIGIHMVAFLTWRTHWIWIAYILATVLAMSILSIPDAFTTTYCTGQFVVFQLNNALRAAFGSYYTFFVLMGMIQLIRAIILKRGDKELNMWLLIGYLSFAIPTVIVFLIASSSRIAIPSIMCGFAILLACIVIAKILPRYHAINH